MFTEFWSLGDHTRQWDCIVTFVKQKERKHVTVSVGEDSRRKYSKKYFLNMGDVEKRECKVIFLNIIGNERLGDQYEICSAYALADDSKKFKLEESYERHLKDKSMARDLKDVDKGSALDDKTLCVACFELQKVLPSPQSN
ncbi:hypothetical protein ILUMI_26673, partial [Ignelater luminosus]